MSSIGNMDFLLKILNRILRNGGEKSFRHQVREEKKKKYLFRNEDTLKHTSSRNTFFRKKKREIFNFAQILWGSFEFFHDHLRESPILGYLGVFMIFLSGYIVVFSPYFKISPNNVLIEADTPWIDVNIAYRTLEDVYGRSIFLLDETTIATKLKESLKNIARIRIDTLYPNGIKVIISGSPIRYIASITWVEKRYGLSENGVLVPESAVNSGSTDTIEIGSEVLKSEIFLNYKQVLSDEKMIYIGKVLQIFREEWPDLILGKSRYFMLENEFHISLESGTRILFTFQNQNSINYVQTLEFIKIQTLSLKSYIQAHKKEILDGNISYIDARIPSKLFVCRDKTVCKENLIMIYGQSYAE